MSHLAMLYIPAPAFAIVLGLGLRAGAAWQLVKQVGREGLRLRPCAPHAQPVVERRLLPRALDLHEQ